MQLMQTIEQFMLTMKNQKQKRLNRLSSSILTRIKDCCDTKSSLKNIL